MAQAPDFILIHCSTSGTLPCATCSRDFLLPLTAIAGFKRNVDGTATIYPKKDWLGQYHCISDSNECHTTIPWPTLVSMLSGSISDIGNVVVTPV